MNGSIVVYEFADFSRVGSVAMVNSAWIANAGLPAIFPADALALDSKMDDGRPDTGAVYTTSVDIN